VAGRDITEGRSSRAIAVDVGVVATDSIWQNTDIAYDTALGGMPFIYAISDTKPYVRQTAPYRKEQFDNQTEPGEQSLTGWWLRSQSSFHEGAGITFYDPGLIPGEGTSRFADSKGVDVWTEGQVTLLKDSTQGHITTGSIASNGRPNQHLRSIQYSGTNAVLLLDEFDVDKIDTSGTVTHFIDYNSGTDDQVYAILLKSVLLCVPTTLSMSFQQQHLLYLQQSIHIQQLLTFIPALRHQVQPSISLVTTVFNLQFRSLHSAPLVLCLRLHQQ